MSIIAQEIAQAVMNEMAARIASCTEFSEKEILEMCMGQGTEQKDKKTKATKKTKALIVSIPEDSEKTDEDEPTPEETVLPNDPFGLAGPSEEPVKKTTKVKASSLIGKSEERAVAETLDEMSQEEKDTRCQKILKSGINKGKHCGKKQKKGSIWCSKHTPKE